MSSATLLAAAITQNIDLSVMYCCHICLGFPLLLLPGTIICIIIFSKQLCQITWPKVFKLLMTYNIVKLVRSIFNDVLDNTIFLSRKLTVAIGSCNLDADSV